MIGTSLFDVKEHTMSKRRFPVEIRTDDAHFTTSTNPKATGSIKSTKANIG